MDFTQIVAQLKADHSRLDNAIAALEGLNPSRRRGRPPKAKQAAKAPGKKRRMSAAARKRISAAMKQRWAQRKGKSAPKKVKTAPKKRAARKPMSRSEEHT